MKLPELIGSLPDQSFPLGGGWRTLDISSRFFGEDLSYAIISDARIAHIDGITGTISINTNEIIDRYDIGVRALNAAGYAEGHFRISVYPIGVGYWKIAENFMVN